MSHPLSINTITQTTANVSNATHAQKDTLQKHVGYPYLLDNNNSILLDMEELRNMLADDPELTDTQALLDTLSAWGIPDLDKLDFIHFL